MTYFSMWSMAISTFSGDTESNNNNTQAVMNTGSCLQLTLPSLGLWN